MNTLVTNLLINSIAVLAASYILPGVHIRDFVTAVVVAVLLAVVNAIVRPILVFLTLPLTIVTFGLFIFVINTLMVLLVERMVAGFSTNGFVWALLFSLVVSIVATALRKV